MMQSNLPFALQLAKRQVPELVYDAVNLEGIHYTLPEVMTLLDGVTVGGHRLSDQEITLNQAAAWKFLFAAIENNDFSLTIEFVCNLHAVAAKETLKCGEFRDQGVTIAGTTYLPPKAAELNAFFETMVSAADKINDIYDQAIFVFLTMARVQFFFDVNKRMGRFMMNGILIQAGYPLINVPAKRQQEFNTLMLAFYTSNDMHEMNKFMRSCLDSRVVEMFN